MSEWDLMSDNIAILYIIGGSGSGRTNILLNSINEQNDIGIIYLYARDLDEPNIKF